MLYELVSCMSGMQEFGESGGSFFDLSRRSVGGENQELLSQFDLMCGLLVPLYSARATEEVFYGRQGITLGTAPEVRCLNFSL